MLELTYASLKAGAAWISAPKMGVTVEDSELPELVSQAG